MPIRGDGVAEHQTINILNTIIMSSSIIIGTIMYRKSKLRLQQEATTFMVGIKDPNRGKLFKFVGIEDGLIIGEDIYTHARIPFVKKELSGGYLVAKDGDKEYPIHFEDYPNVRYKENWSGKVIQKPTRPKLKDYIEMIPSGDRGEIMLFEDGLFTILLDNGSTVSVRRNKFVLKKRGSNEIADYAEIFKPEALI